MSLRKYPANKIAPSSILGDAVELLSRNIIMPFIKIKVYSEKDDCELIDSFYSGKALDNSSATIKKATTESCLKDEFTNINLNGKISGTHLNIKTKVKVRNKLINIINLTGRHKTQNINFNKLTFAEIIKEESNIINSQDYYILLEKKRNHDVTKDDFIVITR